MLSEHTMEDLKVTCLPAGTASFPTYEAFAHVIDSMFNQHAKKKYVISFHSARK